MTRDGCYTTLWLVTKHQGLERPFPKRLISFDIDGTMEFGDPPGRVTIQWVQQAQKQGHIVGSASDRPLSSQRRLWKENGLDVIDFVILKHWLEDLKEMFEVDEYWHVGDTDMDRLIASKAGFNFFWAESFLDDVTAYDAPGSDAS